MLVSIILLLHYNIIPNSSIFRSIDIIVCDIYIIYYIIYYVRRTLGSDEIFVEDVTRTGRRHDDVR